MNRQSIVTEICKGIRSGRDRELGAYIDVAIPWGTHGHISVRVERMTGKCINLHTDMEMLTIETNLLDAAFAGRVPRGQDDESSTMGACA